MTYRITVTFDTDDASFLDDLEVARRHREGVTVKAGAHDRFVEDLLDVTYSVVVKDPRQEEWLQDPNRRWQCYTAEANAMMENAFQNLANGLRNREFGYHELGEMYKREIEAIQQQITPRDGGYTDTEPRGEMVHRLNEVLDEMGYKELEWLP